ncbi:hypothetical protein PGT21_026156 [Puccinia graminis f. sp. tritici]|uniref:Uncharacterized protein n=1 Tax=Puccinia graminis f. sp. tritici TaxID=56615 RepID=A0A5B0QY70_PUCGR|nr:hypothetical protein PGT21_026156 [Puccinia graminis f. sp. tritici]
MLLHPGALAIYGTLSILIAEIPSQCSGASLSKRNPNLEGIYSMFKGPEGSMKSVHQTLAEQIGDEIFAGEVESFQRREKFLGNKKVTFCWKDSWVGKRG